jgi:uncharacterized protein
VTDFTVIKRDFMGNQVLSYTGYVRERGDNFVCINAIFGFSDRDLGYVYLRQGDLFTEWFYSDQWYNIFRVQDVHSQQLKGWYCNITRPTQIETHHVMADDLALDIFVYPDGQTILLDEDEFDELDLSQADTQAAWDAVNNIRQLVNARETPFDEISNHIKL